MLATFMYLFFPHCRCLMWLRLDILCVRGRPPTDNPPFSPSPNLTVHFIEFTYYNNKFPVEARTCKHRKKWYSHSLSQTIRIEHPSPMILTAITRGTIHKPSITHLLDLDIPQHKIHHIMETISLHAIKYLTSLCFIKHKFKNCETPIPLP